MAGSNRHCRENSFIDPVGARKLSALLHRTRTANASPSEMTGETDRLPTTGQDRDEAIAFGYHLDMHLYWCPDATRDNLVRSMFRCGIAIIGQHDATASCEVARDDERRRLAGLMLNRTAILSSRRQRQTGYGGTDSEIRAARLRCFRCHRCRRQLSRC